MHRRDTEGNGVMHRQRCRQFPAMRGSTPRPSTKKMQRRLRRLIIILFYFIFIYLFFFTARREVRGVLRGKPRGRGKDNAAGFITHGNDKRN